MPSTPSLACPAAICALQNVIIMCLMFRLGAERRTTWLAIATALAAVSWWMLSGACPQAVLAGLQGGAVLLMALGGRMPQVGVWGWETGVGGGGVEGEGALLQCSWVVESILQPVKLCVPTSLPP